MINYDKLEKMAEMIAKEDGIYYEWLKGNITDNEYEDFIQNTIEKLEKSL